MTNKFSSSIECNIKTIVNCCFNSLREINEKQKCDFILKQNCKNVQNVCKFICLRGEMTGRVDVQTQMHKITCVKQICKNYQAIQKSCNNIIKMFPSWAYNIACRGLLFVGKFHSISPQIQLVSFELSQQSSQASRIQYPIKQAISERNHLSIL